MNNLDYNHVAAYKTGFHVCSQSTLTNDIIHYYALNPTAVGFQLNFLSLCKEQVQTLINNVRSAAIMGVKK